MEKIKLIAATGNKNKLREFEQIFSSICPVEVIPAKSLVAMHGLRLTVCITKPAVISGTV